MPSAPQIATWYKHLSLSLFLCMHLSRGLHSISLPVMSLAFVESNADDEAVPKSNFGMARHLIRAV